MTLEKSMSSRIAILMGSDSDLPTLEPGFSTFKEFGVTFELFVLSAHRTPDLVHRFAVAAHERGYRVILAAAGGAAHLAGVIASKTPLPVIGIPIPTQVLGGLDSLLSTVQMPGGVPVATVGVGAGGAVNAALLAIQILATADPALMEKILTYKKNLERKVIEKNRTLGIDLPF